MEALRALAVAGLLVSGAVARVYAAGPEQRLAWDHPELELSLGQVKHAHDGVWVELCVRTRAGAHTDSTTVGFPRYRTPSHRWADGVIAGIGHDRTLSVSQEPHCFSMLVARDAQALSLPIGGQTLELDRRTWLALPAANGATPPAIAQIEDPWQKAAEPAPTEVARVAPVPPQVVLVDDAALAAKAAPIARDAIVSVRLHARNVGESTARRVVASIEPASDVYTAQDGAERFELGDLAPGAVVEFVYRCYAARGAAALSFQVLLDHADAGKGGEARVVSLPLAGARELASSEPTSDVDRVVPRSLLKRPTGLAVVLGVEQYRKAPPAKHAAADARTAAVYFEQALGIPKERIELLLDGAVTLAQLQRLFGEDGWLARRAQPDSEVFVFFAGHGTAEPEPFTPYLLPADADPGYLRQTAFPLDRLIEMLTALGARHTSVFLDACFSGLSRDGAELVDGTRPLVLVPRQHRLAGVSVFSAGAGSQIASALDGEGHGLFSYQLFKGLGGEADLDADHEIRAGELKRYLEQAVPRAAETLDREQFPSIVLEGPEQVLVRLP